MNARSYADYAINPLYGILAEHRAAVPFVLISLVAGLVILRWPPRGSEMAGRYRALDRAGRVSVWLVAGSAAAHLGLAVGHTGGWRLAFLAGFSGLSLAAYRLLVPGRVRTWFVPGVLIASISAYAVVGVAGGTPDQVGVATKLAEILALAILLNSGARRMRSTVLPMSMVLLVSLSSWVGALQAGEGGHHAGHTPAPGVALPILVDRPPTAQERQAAERLFEETRTAIAKYSDPETARADGYQVAGLSGRDFHADNPSYRADGRILDPLRPETLVYAESAAGPVLLGAMFQMPEIGQPGPAVGGPLTVWHAHDHVCWSVLPPSLAGLSDPFGMCPAGTITLPITNEMIHVWILPGIDDPFGDLPDTWLDDYLDDQVIRSSGPRDESGRRGG